MILNLFYLHIFQGSPVPAQVPLGMDIMNSQRELNLGQQSKLSAIQGQCDTPMFTCV